MTKINIYKVCFLLFLLVIPLVILFPRAIRVEEMYSGRFSQNLEDYVRSNFPFLGYLNRINVTVRYYGGNREQNGVFIGEDILIKNVGPPPPGIVEKNNEAVLEFARDLRSRDIPFYFTLIPTSSGVLRQSLPSFAEVFDQRRFIEDVYSRMTGKMTTIDTFLPLNANRERYVFYRTENSLTPYGGYYVYEALAKRLRATDNPTFSTYNINYGDNFFYGDLFNLSPYQNVRPDVLVMFDYSRHAREYMVTHVNPEGVKTYHGLFPRHLEQPGSVTDIFLGGMSARIDIVTSAPFTRRLLVFGDRTALTYLPFLANHYQQITLIDLSWELTPFGVIEIEEYDQVLMAYSVETYTDFSALPSRIEKFIE